ncbi:hypothetical protein VOLCADRAFT_106564 [Volvox carteri f. nagariensis]|uniref:Tubulin--tyrosine ligase-like protein 5 n=1 Tax=Volvox carteri f. nagariensis TaxID=3068 RepID=D8U877_VOLCA|nr:uncharacterized protein VOLCADRAFT_106564 [Volvox carteri f. nagariensis]EFJ44092.1 hypothetical protein VOLCADRAFT_106564 [Volvox carteri f. nagariensis]|eukprot:XP_002954893.1 hypothetical protein VOLCADRAFT_106564 [Volvox carteri f. nagariensis]
MQLEHLVARGPETAAAVTRRHPGFASEDPRQSTSAPACSLGYLSQSARSKKRAGFRTHALPVDRHNGGGAHPPLFDQRIPPSVDLRRVALVPERITAAPRAPFRFWVDELLWSQGRVAVELFEAVLTEAGGVRTGGPSRQEERELRRWRRRRQQQQLTAEEAAEAAAAPGPSLGSSNMECWEVLWTKSTYAISAARSMRPGQLHSTSLEADLLTDSTTPLRCGLVWCGLVSAVIGLNCLTMKKRLLLTLRGALGPEAAFAITPCSFALPEDMGAWEDFLKRQQQHYNRHNRNNQQQGMQSQGREEGQGDDGGDGGGGGNVSGNGAGGDIGGFGSSLWILKTGQDAASKPASLVYRVRSPILNLPLSVPPAVNNSFLGAMSTRRGLVLFSTDPYDKAAAERQQPRGGGGGGAAAAGPPLSPPPPESSAAAAHYQLPASHITNYARNNNTLVWGLHQLAEHLGPARFSGVWEALRGACSRALAAAAPSLVEAHAWLRPAVQEYGFQVLGVDFLLDERLKPWLLEFNSAPSIMVQHEDDATRALVYEQKYGMLRDTWEVVRCRVYPREPAEVGQGGVCQRVL